MRHNWLLQQVPEQSRKRVILQGATHNMWVQQPEECLKAVLELILQR